MAIRNAGGAAVDKMILVCSGCSADVGYLADKAARILSVTGQGKLGVLDADKAAAILAEAKTAKQVLLIDGCENGCGLALAREAGLDCDHLVVTDLGLVKGSAPADGKNMDLVAAKARELLSCKG
ncbi:MAG: DGC domain protein [Deltaproteobacteria bacterium ADurb.Bin510]|nr:MAG: DGC domain protein [Deltaproteobacteria bacterium ADurb.Bin510]